MRFCMPSLLESSAVVGGKKEALFGLGLTGGSLGGEWTRLYTSEENGLSFNRVCHHILGYRGPTVLLIRDFDGAVFGFFTSEAWKEANAFYGSSECFLFRLFPSFVEARPKMSGAQHYMYLNVKGFSLPHGQ